MLAFSLFFGWPSSSVSTLTRSNSTGAGLSAASCAVVGTLVTSVRLTLPARVKSNLPAVPALIGQFTTTSMPSLVVLTPLMKKRPPPMPTKPCEAM